MEQDEDVLLPWWPRESQPGQGRVSKLLTCTSLAAPKPPPLTSAVEGEGVLLGYVHKLLGRESFIQVTPLISLSVHFIPPGLKTGTSSAVAVQDLGF